MTKGQLALAIALLVILVDQMLKIWVKTDFYTGEEREVTSWFSLHFIENDGMAFGWTFGSKLVLTVFRILFVGALIYVMLRIRSRSDIKKGFMACLALILAGALGNIIDCVLYGVIFNDPAPYETAVMFSASGGYAPLFHGKVVDMLSFHFFSFDWPAWIPLIGGSHFDFFGPVFNIADAAISVGIIAVIIFYAKQINILFNLKKTGKNIISGQRIDNDHNQKDHSGQQ